jgi:hypothetical protein
LLGDSGRTTRCVRRASLLGEEPFDRKKWIEHRLQELSDSFSVSVGGFSVIDNHLHVGQLPAPDDYTVRTSSNGKAAISTELSGIVERLGNDAERWWSRIENLSNGRLLGRFFATHRGRLREVARNLRVHHLANLGGCLAR